MDPGGVAGIGCACASLFYRSLKGDFSGEREQNFPTAATLQGLRISPLRANKILISSLKQKMEWHHIAAATYTVHLETSSGEKSQNEPNRKTASFLELRYVIRKIAPIT